MRIELPGDVAFIIERMKARGYRADIVGGCVRDILLGKAPDDYDITTNASPEAVKAVFSDYKTIDTGIKHGTVTLMLNSAPYEITTYRIDGEYKDSRHPESVTFTANIEDDLARRDFTVNAMAYTPECGFTDAFGGMSDLYSRTIRAVGKAEARFSEDALRILRAVRFASVLDFGIEESTALAIHEGKERLADVSAERIFAELKKLIGGKAAYNILAEYEDVISSVLPELSPLTLPRRDAFDSASPTERVAMLFELSSGEQGWQSAARRLKADNKTREHIADIIKALLRRKCADSAEVGVYLVGKDDSVVKSALRVSLLLGYTDGATVALAEELMSSGLPRKISDLTVGGTDIKALGIAGARVGRILSSLLLRVASGELPNDKNILLSQAAKIQ